MSSPAEQLKAARAALDSARVDVSTNYRGIIEIKPNDFGKIVIERSIRGDEDTFTLQDGGEAEWLASQLIRIYGHTSTMHNKLRVAIRELIEAVKEHRLGGIEDGELSHAVDNLEELL